MKLLTALFLTFFVNVSVSASEKATFHYYWEMVEKPYSQKREHRTYIKNEDGNYEAKKGYLVWLPEYTIIFLEENFLESMSEIKCEYDSSKSLDYIRYVQTYTFEEGVYLHHYGEMIGITLKIQFQKQECSPEDSPES